MRHMRLSAILDCDGPLLDFTKAVNKLLGDENIVPDSWSYYQDHEKSHLVEQAFLDMGWWETFEPVADAQTVVELLRREDVEITFATASSERCIGWETARRKVLNKYFDAKNDEIVIVSRKHRLHGTIFVDDKPSHIEAWITEHEDRSTPVLWRMPYNAHVNCARAIDSWGSVLATYNAYKDLSLIQAIEGYDPHRWR